MTAPPRRSSRPARTIVRSLLLAIAVYAGLLAAWPVVGGAYARAFRSAGTLLFSSIGDASVRYRPAARVIVYADTDVVVRNRRTRAEGARPMSTRYRGYFPAAMLLALVAATPLPWRRRLRSLAWGLALLHALVAGRELLVLLDVLSGDNPVATIELSPFWRTALRSVAGPLATSTASTFVLPVLVWVPVTFRGRDWARLFGEAARDQAQGPRSRAP